MTPHYHAETLLRELAAERKAREEAEDRYAREKQRRREVEAHNSLLESAVNAWMFRAESAEAQVKVLREALEEQLKLWYGGEEMSDIGLRRWEETAYQKARAALATTEAQRGEE